MYSCDSMATFKRNNKGIVTMVNDVNDRVLFNQHMIDFGRRKYHANNNWTEPLKTVVGVGEFLQTNSFMYMMSKAMYPFSSNIYYQFELQYYGDTAVVRSKKKSNWLTSSKKHLQMEM